MTPSVLQLQPSTPPVRDDRHAARGQAVRRAARFVLRALVVAGVAALAAVAYRTLAQPPVPDGRVAGLTSANEVTVAARTGGRIRTLLVAEGETVAAGSPIAVLDAVELEAERRQQTAVIAELTARLARGRDVVALEGQRAEGQMARARADLSAARSRLQQAQAELDDVRAEAARLTVLVEQQLAPRRDRDRLQAQVAIAEARRAAAEDAIAAAEADLTLAGTLVRQTGLARRDVEQIRAQLQQAEAQLAQIDARVADVTVVAPIDGAVSLRVAREGEIVNAGAPILVLTDPHDVWITAAVEEGVVGSLALGDELQVELLTGERRTGTVSFIAPEAGFATQRDVSRTRRDIRTFNIKVALPNPDRRLHPGMTAYVLLPTATPAGR